MQNLQNMVTWNDNNSKTEICLSQSEIKILTEMQSEIRILTMTGYGNNSVTSCLASVNKCDKYINKQIFQKVHKNQETKI